MVATVCPHCGQIIQSVAGVMEPGRLQPTGGAESRSPWKYLLVLGMGGLSTALLFLFMMVATDPGDNLELTEARVDTSARGVSVLYGSVRNRTDRPYHDVRALFTFTDTRGHTLGEVLATADFLNAGGTWTIKQKLPAGLANQLRAGRLECRFRSATRAEPLVSFTCGQPGTGP